MVWWVFLFLLLGFLETHPSMQSAGQPSRHHQFIRETYVFALFSLITLASFPFFLSVFGWMDVGDTDLLLFVAERSAYLINIRSLCWLLMVFGVASLDNTLSPLGID